MTKLVFDGAVNAAKGAKLNSKSGRAAAEGQQGVDPLAGVALAAPVQGAPQAKVGAVPTVAGKASPKVDAVKIVKPEADAKDENHKQDEAAQPTSQGEHLAMVDAASAAAVGVMTTETVAAQGEGGSSDGGDGGDDSTPLIIGGLVLVGGGIAAAASGGGNSSPTPAPTPTPTPTNTAAPVFTSTGTGSAPENATATGYKAVATDADAGQTVTYSIVQTTAGGGADFALFNIDAATGVVTFKTAPNFEAPADAGADNVYNIIVTATDSFTGGTKSTTQNVAITVTNVNENPVISSNGGGDAATISVAENTTAVTTVTSTDPDAGATKTFSISGGADAALFNIDAATGVLTFKSAPNFEAPADAGANNVYDVVVKVSDGTNSDTQAIAITVTNVNEAPVIGSNGGGDTAAISVAENTTAVTTVTSTDADAGATKTFSISGGADAALFAINATTGALTFVTAPNFEVPTDAGGNNVYDVIVKVTDNGNPGLSDTQAIAVTVTNVVEPVVAVADSFAVTEGATLNGAVGTNDTLEGAVTFNLVNPGAAPAGLTFTANSSTGAFIFNANDAAYNSLAAGATQNVTFDYTVTNGSTTSTATATIVVTGVNDAAVIGGATTASVTEDTNVVGGNLTATGLLTVTDVDTGQASFTAATTTSALGTFTIDASGAYTYTASNSNAAIQALNTGQTLTDTFSVSSKDGTTSSVVITINGLSEPVLLSLDSGYPGDDNSVGTADPINAALDAFVLTDNGNTSNNVVINGFGANDRFQFTLSQNGGADPAYSFGTADGGKDLTIGYANGGTATSIIVVNDVLQAGSFVLDEAAANTALNLALGTANIDYFQIA